MLGYFRRLVSSDSSYPRLRLTRAGFVVHYRGLLGPSLDVRWENIVEVSASRVETPALSEIRFEYQFGPGKVMRESISDAWPGFVEVRTAMEGALALPQDWWAQVKALPVGADPLRIYRRSSNGAG